jgi:hypothetical protein
MSSTVLRSSTRVVAPVLLVALLALLTAWQGGVRAAEGRAAAAGDDGTTMSVHGDWTIDVYAVDGELVDQRAFTNALSNTGRVALAQVMSGSWELTGWQIMFDCGYGSGWADYCYIQEPQIYRWGERVSETPLEVLYEPNAEHFALQGTIVAPKDFTLRRVDTGTTRHNESETNLMNPFTFKILPVEEQVEVMEGQSIVIRVELSFS